MMNDELVSVCVSDEGDINMESCVCVSVPAERFS